MRNRDDCLLILNKINQSKTMLRLKSDKIFFRVMEIFLGGVIVKIIGISEFCFIQANFYFLNNFFNICGAFF